ncbi:MAG: ATP-binding protein [Planctomycetota bacterium]|nr:ATP-binding protein [Planctomycetota bacterium]
MADDGEGMALDVLEYLVHNIGGSAKRTGYGVELGITQKDFRFSKGGRRLIGKIGIGLFAVAQLTRHFRIITKPRNEAFRYVAEIRLNLHDEERLAKIKPGQEPEFESGDVELWREPAADKSAHGTQVVLLNLKDYTRSLLQSRERWTRHQEADSLLDELVRPPPVYHIGSVDPSSHDVRQDTARLPWTPSDDPPDKFRKLFQAIVDQVEIRTSVPTLEASLDNYLATLWTLALATPVEYIERHPFELTAKDEVRVFILSNRDREPAKELNLKAGQTVRQAAGFSKVGTTAPFQVFVDGVQLLRPIRFRDLPAKSSAKLRQPLLFVGQCRPDLKHFPADATGGRELAFEGYFFWTPTVVPKENNGLMLRIGDASGTLFDDTFLHYEVSEQTRLRQITAEVYVSEGLDAALNIDRESFNYSHPHFQFLTKWVHRALRQLATKHKAIGAELRADARDQHAGQVREALQQVVDETLGKAPDAEDEPPEVLFVDDERSPVAKQARKEGAIVFPKRVLDDYPEPERRGADQERKRTHFEEQLKAVAQILDGYGLLKQLTYQQQEELLRAIARVFLTGGGQ